MRVAVSAEISRDGGMGGVEQFLVALLTSLARHARETKLTYVGSWVDPNWLTHYQGAGVDVVIKRPSVGSAILPALPYRFRRLVVGLAATGRGWRDSGAVKDEFYDSLPVDVVHFPTQRFVRTRKATVYNPHDLQHRHLPAFFDPIEIARRENDYRIGCEAAHIVVAESEWSANDIREAYGIDPSKIRVIRRGPPTSLYGTLPESSRRQLISSAGLERPFVFFPAQTWPHKNHLRLVDAFAAALARGADLDLVLTGSMNSHWAKIEERIDGAGLGARVKALGYVSNEMILALYQSCRFVIFPSLFEGGGFPVIEAMEQGAPLACSDVTCIPEYAGEACWYFNPYSVESMAEAILLLDSDEELRGSLVAQGEVQARKFSWDLTAKQYLEVYSEAADLVH